MMRFGWGHHHLNVQDCVFYSTNHVLGLFERVDHVLFSVPDQDFAEHQQTHTELWKEYNKRCWVAHLPIYFIMPVYRPTELRWNCLVANQCYRTNGLGRCVHTCRNSCHTFKVRELLQLDKTMYIDVHDIHRCSYWCTHGCVRKLYRDAVCYSKLLVNSRPYSPNRIPYQPPNNTHLENLNQP